MLELVQLTRSYGDVVALDGLSFEVPADGMFGFVGPNGAGKTTAMRIVLGVLEADSGEVRWNGAPVSADDRSRFGYMPEERGLYPKMRVGDQLSYLARLHGSSAQEAVAKAERWCEALGISDRIDSRVEELSLGNQQRVQLGAALVHDPDLLVLDEPFSGLDPEGVDVLAGVLGERARAGVPIVFSSHQLELVERLCRAVAIVNEGSVVATGTVDELRDRDSAHVLRVEVDGAAANWADALPAVQSIDRATDGSLHLTLASATDDQQVLDAARAAGTVRHFGAVRPTLSEIFREAVA